MTQISVINKHLKSTIDYAKVYFDDEEEPPMELFFELINELKVSNLIVPVNENEDEVFFENVIFEDEDLTFLPLFTDIDEYESFVGEDSEFEPVSFEFDQFVDLILENDLDGIVINIEGKSLPLDKDFLKNMYFDVETKVDSDIEPFTSMELKDILENLNNDVLIEMLTSDERFTNDRLFAELSASTMLNIVVSDESLDEYAVDGVIKAEDVGGFSLCNIMHGDIILAAIFTDIDAAKEVIKDMEGHCYIQITKLSALFDFILRNDMDGVMINPNLTNCLIGRVEFLSQASGIEVIVEDPRLDSCLDYAFMM